MCISVVYKEHPCRKKRASCRLPILCVCVYIYIYIYIYTVCVLLKRFVDFYEIP